MFAFSRIWPSGLRSSWSRRSEERRGGDQPSPGGELGGGQPPLEPIRPSRGSAQPRLPQDTHRVDHQAPQAEPEGWSSIPSFFSVASTSGIAHDTLKFLLLFISHKYFHAYILTQKKHFLPK